MLVHHKHRGAKSPSKGVRHRGCKITHRMKFVGEVYLYSWLDAPMVSMGMGRAAQ